MVDCDREKGGFSALGSSCSSLHIRRDKVLVRCFFFQAEDGIRDYKVTGVQTCALPICTTLVVLAAAAASTTLCEPTDRHMFGFLAIACVGAYLNRPRGAWLALAALSTRSEERRVGKECRSRWSPYH